jgi:hypothetical protein
MNEKEREGKKRKERERKRGEEKRVHTARDAAV